MIGKPSLSAQGGLNPLCEHRRWPRGGAMGQGSRTWQLGRPRQSDPPRQHIAQQPLGKSPRPLRRHHGREAVGTGNSSRLISSSVESGPLPRAPPIGRRLSRPVSRALAQIGQQFRAGGGNRRTPPTARRAGPMSAWKASPRRSAWAFRCPWACAVRAADVPAVRMFAVAGAALKREGETVQARLAARAAGVPAPD